MDFENNLKGGWHETGLCILYRKCLSFVEITDRGLLSPAVFRVYKIQRPKPEQ
jgi:hypothetical protein